MSKVYAQMVIEMELDLDDSLLGRTILNLASERLRMKFESEGVSRFITDHPCRILNVYSPTKDWQIGSQVALNQPFD